MNCRTLVSPETLENRRLSLAFCFLAAQAFRHVPQHCEFQTLSTCPYCFTRAAKKQKENQAVSVSSSRSSLMGFARCIISVTGHRTSLRAVKKRKGSEDAPFF